MNTIRKLCSPWVIVALLLPTCGGAYVGSYFAVTDYYAIPPDEFSVRAFKHSWMVDFYRPMIYVESKVRRKTIIPMHIDRQILGCLSMPPVFPIELETITSP